MSRRLTSEIFIEKATKIHGDSYDYSEVNYIDNHTKVDIFCRIHGVFSQTPNNHLNGANCPECGKDTTKSKTSHTIEQFIEKSKIVHRDTYDYSLVEYNTTNTKVQIICQIHGIFEQTPKLHYKTGCPKCGNKRGGQTYKITTEVFLKRAKNVHGDTYDYSKSIYTNSEEKVVIICKAHGEFNQLPNRHLEGMGCRKCAFIKNAINRTKTVDSFIEEANYKHNNFYNYHKSVYDGRCKKVTIICPIHGDFEQSPSNHISGQGCPTCGKEDTGFRKSDYIKKAKERICTFYTIKCFNEDEEFYKIGITVKTVQERYLNTNTMPYNYEIISEIQGEAGFIWDMELAEKRKLRRFNYQPTLKFAGSKTECFTQYIINEAN